MRTYFVNVSCVVSCSAGHVVVWCCRADPTTVVTTAKQSTSGRRARHLVDSDDESIESAAASIGVVRVSVLEATARTPFPEAARLTTSTHAVLAGETVCAPSLQSESSPEGMYKHSWKSSTTRQCNISVKADWKERGRIVVEVFGANMQPVARAADAWSDDDELTGPSSVNTSLGSVKFAIRDVVSSDQQPITEWYTLRRSPSSGKHVFGPIEVLVRLEFVTSKQRTQPSTSLNSLVSIVRDSLSRRPGGVTALQTSLHSNSKGGRITARDLDRSLKAVDASLPIDQLKQLARALLREERVGSGFSDDDDGPSELDIKIRGDTLVNFLPLLKLLQPASVSNAEGVHSSSTAAAQIDRLQLPDRSSEVAAVESKSLTDATSSVISAFRSVCGGDASKSPIASVFALPRLL